MLNCAGERNAKASKPMGNKRAEQFSLLTSDTVLIISKGHLNLGEKLSVGNKLEQTLYAYVTNDYCL